MIVDILMAVSLLGYGNMQFGRQVPISLENFNIKMEAAAAASEILVPIYQTIQHHLPQGHNLNLTDS
jgi:hypothetical protein